MAPRKTGVETSKKVASVASQGVRKPGSLTNKQIRQVSGAALAKDKAQRFQSHAERSSPIASLIAV